MRARIEQQHGGRVGGEQFPDPFEDFLEQPFDLHVGERGVGDHLDPVKAVGGAARMGLRHVLQANPPAGLQHSFAAVSPRTSHFRIREVSRSVDRVLPMVARFRSQQGPIPVEEGFEQVAV
ncbi:hypothetical protein GCM10009675_14590 [Prauserella alba]|uniref:Uncharacterized protein n=1 Tax=Prauserella alba TaxID=176898 RepID=A0ABN1VAM3_9PSEU